LTSLAYRDLVHIIKNVPKCTLNSKYSDINDRGVKQVLFNNLARVNMPAIMIQTSFITNTRECKRLLSEEYQNDISEGVVKGIEKYIQRGSAEKD